MQQSIKIKWKNDPIKKKLQLFLIHSALANYIYPVRVYMFFEAELQADIKDIY